MQVRARRRRDARIVSRTITQFWDRLMDADTDGALRTLGTTRRVFQSKRVHAMLRRRVLAELPDVQQACALVDHSEFRSRVLAVLGA